MSLSAAERETVIVFNDDDEMASVYTAQRTVITKLKKNSAATLLDEGRFEGSAWAKFEIPKALVSFRSTRVKRELTAEQREVLGERLREARAA
jgi:hypothetical protein